MSIKHAFVFLGVIVAAAGCSAAAASPTPASFPAGTFENNDWAWEFKSDGTFLTSGPIGSETGTYQVSGSQITVTCQCCGDVKGAYTWAFDGSELSFTLIEDACSNRKDVVDGSTWVKKP